jgi:hypothetical protein
MKGLGDALAMKFVKKATVISIENKFRPKAKVYKKAHTLVKVMRTSLDN